MRADVHPHALLPPSGTHHSTAAEGWRAPIATAAATAAVTKQLYSRPRPSRTGCKLQPCSTHAQLSTQTQCHTTSQSVAKSTCSSLGVRSPRRQPAHKLRCRVLPIISSQSMQQAQQQAKWQHSATHPPSSPPRARLHTIKHTTALNKHLSCLQLLQCSGPCNLDRHTLAAAAALTAAGGRCVRPVACLLSSEEECLPGARLCCCCRTSLAVPNAGNPDLGCCRCCCG